MSEVIDVQGIKLMRGNGAVPEVFVHVEGITVMDTVGVDGRALRPVTTLSDNEVHKHKLGKLADMPEIACEGLYDFENVQHVGILQDHRNRVKRNFQLVVVDDSNEVLKTIGLPSCWVLTPVVGAPADGDFTFSFSLKPQGLVTGLLPE